jgi:hypothetical protein
VREISLVGGGLDPVGSVGIRAELFVFKGSVSGWIDDSVGELRSEIRGMERGGDAACGLAARMRKGVVLVLRRIVGSSVLGGDRFLCGDFGTAAETSSVTGAVLVRDCWWN